MADHKEKQRMNTPEKCKHGNPYFCGLCRAEKAPKCKHGNPFYCGFCLAETGDGRVASMEPAK